MTAGKIGLMVITLERYFKVVHAVFHRKYYRSWITLVGVAVPWIRAYRILFVFHPSNCINKSCARTVPDYGFLAKRRWCKGTYVDAIVVLCNHEVYSPNRPT